MATQAFFSPIREKGTDGRDSLKSNSWERVVVFDPESGNVDIRRKKKANAHRGNQPYPSLDLNGRKSISIYVEQNDETKLKTAETRTDSDRFLARLTLDHLSLINQARFAFGFISTLYVAVELQSSNSSLKHWSRDQ
ncbi:hypothetical protein E8E11_005814 [Didymella keratinophila]|nr:hypothetical protein E8E11_005814 [Didymella keratinophila]